MLLAAFTVFIAIEWFGYTKKFNSIAFYKFQMQHCILVSSVQFSHSAVSNSLRSRGLQHARLPCPSPVPGACSNSCPSVMPCNHLILCCPLLLLHSIFPSIRVFSNESVVHINWPKYCIRADQFCIFQNFLKTELYSIYSFVQGFFPLIIKF